MHIQNNHYGGKLNMHVSKRIYQDYRLLKPVMLVVVVDQGIYILQLVRMVAIEGSENNISSNN